MVAGTPLLRGYIAVDAGDLDTASESCADRWNCWSPDRVTAKVGSRRTCTTGSASFSRCVVT